MKRYILLYAAFLFLIPVVEDCIMAVVDLLSEVIERREVVNSA